jgi:hypothetical protein
MFEYNPPYLEEPLYILFVKVSNIYLLIYDVDKEKDETFSSWKLLESLQTWRIHLDKNKPVMLRLILSKKRY